VTFLKEWNQGTNRSYREQIINNANKQHYQIIVELEDLLAFD
jgi:DNA replication licensing factor MCM5